MNRKPNALELEAIGSPSEKYNLLNIDDDNKNALNDDGDSSDDDNKRISSNKKEKTESLRNELLDNELEIMQHIKSGDTLKHLFLSWFNIWIPSFAFFGVQLCWALQGGFVTPQLEELGASEDYMSYIWIAGPVSGIIVQPIIGIWSDNMDENMLNKYGGRRRPFIFIGCILLIISLLVFSNCTILIIAIIAFWCMDISANIVQAPLRALISDMIPAKYSSIANGVFGLEHGLGASTSYLLGYFLSYNTAGSSNGISLLFGIASIIVFIGCCITLYFTKGEQLLHIHGLSLSEIHSKNRNYQQEQIIDDELDNMRNERNEKSKCKQLLDAIRFMPTPIWRAFIVKFWCYFGHYSSFIYTSDWFGRNIMNGDPEEKIDEYNKGVKYANLGMFIMSFLSIFISIIIPIGIRKYGYRVIYFLCMLELGLVLIMMSFIPSGNVLYGIIAISLLCVTQSSSQIVGWSIVTETLSLSKDSKNKRGIYSTVFNLANCFPEIVVSIIASPIIKYANYNVASIIFVGGCGSIIGSICALFIIEPKKWIQHNQ